LSGERVERRLTAILAADVVGYSRLMGADEEGTLAALKTIRRELVDPRIVEHRGRIVKTTGDGLLVEFASVVDAVRCAVDVQREMAERNADKPAATRIEFRVGINLGDIIIDGDDIFGDGVNVAARLETLADPGGICVSRVVRDQVRDKLAFTFEDMGEQQVKNIARPVRAHRIRIDSPVAAPPAAAAEPALTSPDKPSIAVLPFQNMSSDPEQEFFTDGIVDDLTTALSRFRGLSVVARHSSFVYKGHTADVKDIGRALGARYVLSGSIRKAGTRMRMSAQLIDAVAGNHIWAERYDRDVTDVFALQDDITNSVTSAVLPALNEAERARVMRKRPQDLAAWETYQRGIWNLEHVNVGAANETARDFLQQAIAQDPTLACAYSGLAYTYNRDVAMGRMTPFEAFGVAEPLARTAVNLDDLDATAHAVLAVILLFMRGDYDAATTEARRALELNPGLGIAHGAMGLVLTYSGDAKAGREFIREGLRLDPRTPMLTHHFNLAYACYFLRDYSGALEAIKSRPESAYNSYFRAANYGQLGEMPNARQALQKAEALKGHPFGFSSSGQRMPWIRQEDGDHILEGLRKAGWQGD